MQHQGYASIANARCLGQAKQFLQLHRQYRRRGIATVIATIVLWLMVDGMHVFSEIEDFLNTIGASRYVQLLDYARLPRVISYATITAVANTIILTAMATLGALLYNVVASLVGGVRVSLMDE